MIIDKQAGPVTDRANAVGMSRHPKDIGTMVPKGRHALVIFDGAGWHRSRDLVCPDNVSVLRVPPHSPELNAAGNVFQFPKANHCANQVSETTEDVKTKVAAVREAFAGQADRIKSMGHRSWARVLQEKGNGKPYDKDWPIGYNLVEMVL